MMVRMQRFIRLTFALTGHIAVGRIWIIPWSGRPVQSTWEVCIDRRL